MQLCCIHKHINYSAQKFQHAPKNVLQWLSCGGTMMGSVVIGLH